jgi:hypothetical protein
MLDQNAPLTISVPEAGKRYFGLCRNASYDAAARGEIPVIKIGRLDQPRERNRTARWTTRLDPNYTAAYGCDELHAVFFTPNDGTGGRCGVVVQIPETTDYLFAHSMAVATQSRARVVFLCDTAAQAGEVVRKAAKMLPNHCRVSMERAQAGAWGCLQ